MTVTAEDIRRAMENLDAPPLTDEQAAKVAVLLATRPVKRPELKLVG